MVAPVTCYPIASKQKSVNICKAFAAGCGGEVVTGERRLRDGPAFFWGVDPTNLHLWHEARDSKDRHYYYGDNAYIDSARGEYFRVSYDRLQHRGLGESSAQRFAQLGVEIEPWTDHDDGHIVICPQSDFFMEQIVGLSAPLQPPFYSWLDALLAYLSGAAPDREVRVREWQRDKSKLTATLRDDLEGAYCLLTWSSAAAVTALLAGVPSISLGAAIAHPMEGSIDRFFDLPRHDRREWAGIVANNQWTLEEMRSGACWESLRRQRWLLVAA